MSLSAANVIQAKSDHLTDTIAPVALDDPEGTKAGSTVIIEISGGGAPIMDGGMAGVIPDGFELDALGLVSAGARYLHVLRKRDVAAGEGILGSTSWDIAYVAAQNWGWRVTEWDRGLEPVSPLEAVAYGSDGGTGPTSLSTGTAPAGGNTGRSDLVALAWHYWSRSSNTAATGIWSGHTNSFTVRDTLRWTSGMTESESSWSWLFSPAAGQFETTATINLSPRVAADLYVALMVVYAATTYA
jgi:hypothetical protein